MANYLSTLKTNFKTSMSRAFPKNFKIEPLIGDEMLLYAQLYAYYANNGLYDGLRSSEYYLNHWHENMHPLYNPANRSVEFFAARVIPGVLPDALPIVTDNERIIEPIQQVWKWSNLNAKKIVATRWLAIYGDLFSQVMSDEEKVYFKFIKPEYVTDFLESDRGILQYIRVDVPIADNKWHTEVWDKQFQYIWEGMMKPSDNAEPQMIIPISDYGIDFVPFVHTKFRDVGEERGWSAITQCLDKIDELNRMATRAHEMMFRYNKPTWILQRNTVTSEGYDSPAFDVPASFLSTSSVSGQTTYEDVDETIISLPGQGTFSSLIPDIKYADALAFIQDQMAEIEKDMPELAYYRLREQGELSGRAVRLLLGDAVSRIEEARTNFEGSLIRLDEMALTVGSAKGTFSGLGDYDSGDFDHQFKTREIFPTSDTEKLAVLKAKAETKQLASASGYADLAELGSESIE